MMSNWPTWRLISVAALQTACEPRRLFVFFCARGGADRRAAGVFLFAVFDVRVFLTMLPDYTDELGRASFRGRIRVSTQTSLISPAYYRVVNF